MFVGFVLMENFQDQCRKMFDDEELSKGISQVQVNEGPAPIFYRAFSAVMLFLSADSYFADMVVAHFDSSDSAQLQCQMSRGLLENGLGIVIDNKVLQVRGRTRYYLAARRYSSPSGN